MLQIWLVLLEEMKLIQMKQTFNVKNSICVKIPFRINFVTDVEGLV